MEAYLGSICVFGFNFAPYGWALCQGQILPISSNTALFSLLGTYYGGNGTSNFGLPNLQGRATLSQGHLQGGSMYVMGEMAGTETVSILTSNMPAHNHGVTAAVKCNTAATGTMSGAPQNNYPALGTPNYVLSSGTGNMAGVSMTLGTSGGSQPVDINDPYLVMNYSIALQGIYPTRN